MEPDFSGWATKNDLLCTDGRTIVKDAFAHQDKAKVPLVWAHQHGNTDILGHAILENRAFGVYTHGYFNETPSGLNAKALVKHGDISSLSIYANQLKQSDGGRVVHGMIREVSLVMAGANSGAVIEDVYMKHSDGTLDELEGEAIIHTGLNFEFIRTETAEGDSMAHDGTAAPAEKSIQEIVDGMTDEQKLAAAALVARAMAAQSEVDSGTADNSNSSDASSTDNSNVQHSADAEEGSTDEQAEESADDENLAHSDSSNQEGTEMTHNLFEQQGEVGNKTGRATLTHDQIKTIVDDGIKMGSFKASVLAHAGEYGITDIDLLFPDAKNLSSNPELLARRVEWVDVVLKGIKHAPFAKIKSIVADLTAEEARAKGYIKGTEKKEEVISLLRRTTQPTTVYKKQKLDRDDIIDITEFDVISWLKAEIRMMMDEEIARAILVGDGRSVISADKVKDPIGATDGVGIRSIANDHELYALTVQLPANVSPEDQIDAIARSRKDYRGTGNPTFFTTDPILTDMLLLKDKMGRRLYGTTSELASALRVSQIVTVEVMEESPTILGIIVNLVDYTAGTNKGGELTFFEDFDIDFNQNKYLLETRLSGALTKPKSAVVIKRDIGTSVTPTAPSFDGPTNTITIPSKAGVNYLINGDVVAAGSVVITQDTEVNADPASGYYFPAGTVQDWNFVHTAA